MRVFQTSRAGDKLTDKGTLDVSDGTGSSASATITVHADQERQQILGFGGALTQSTASVLAKLPADDRKKVIDAYFSPDGAGYTLARTHIASCDFSTESYQYSTKADPQVADFSIAHDQTELIPLLKDALSATNNTLKIVAAPWSAPAWMKTPPVLYVKPTAANNYQGQDPSLDAANYDAYALYLVKYLKAYKDQGLPIWGLSPQNEPLGNGGNWETMRWDPPSMAKFIGTNLGPKLTSEGLDTKLMIFDHNKGAPDGDAVQWATTLLSDANASPYIWGTAIHWYGSTVNVFEDGLDAIHNLDPKRAILATEATIDGLTDHGGQPASAEYQGSWLKDDFYWTKTAYDWGYWWTSGAQHDLHPVYEPVYRYARDIIGGLNHWYVGWIDWNVALDSTGGPNHENNLCAAPIMVDTQSHQVFYSPLYYVMSHFSKFIKPDAHVLSTEVSLSGSLDLGGYDGMPTEGVLATSSKNPDGSYAIVLFNQTAKPVDYEVDLGGQHASSTIDAQSLQTLIWTPAID